jgi:hypothetical protein
MTETNTKTPPRDLHDALRQFVLTRVSAINGRVLARLATVSDDLDAGSHLAALGGLDGLEREIATMRNFLLLLSQPEHTVLSQLTHNPKEEL